jgi:hypothetical protein
VVRVLGNGDCGASVISLAQQERDSFDNADELRGGARVIRAIATRFYARREDEYLMARHRAGLDRIFPESVEEYCAFMGADGTHFTGVEFSAIAAVLDLQIVVVQTDDESPVGLVTDVYGHAGADQVFVWYTPEFGDAESEVFRAGHYDLLRDARIVRDQ